MFLNIIDSLVPLSQRTQNEEEQRKTRVVYIFLFIANGFALTLATLRIIRGDSIMAIAIYGAVALACLTPLIHHLSGSLKMAAAWMIFLSTSLFIGQGAFSGGLLSVSNIWFAPLSIFILLTLGRRITFIWIGAITLRGLVLWILKHQFGINLPNFQNPVTAEVTWLLAIPASLLLIVFSLQGFFLAHKTALDNLAEYARTLKEQSLELKKARDTAIEATNSRGQFIAIVSHEIRTPMNGILGVAQLLYDTPLNADQVKYIQVLNQSAEGLLSILNDILDFSKLEAGKLDVRSEVFDLKKLCTDTLEIFSGIVESKKIKLDLIFDPSLPEKVAGDPLRIRQILINLIGNAIKFTETGTVSLEVASKLEASRVLFSIKDSGIGMSASTLAKLFQPYTQADSSFSRKYGGTGLGLAICSKLSQMMGGTITAESKEGVGSCFNFEVPLKEIVVENVKVNETLNFESSALTAVAAVTSTATSISYSVLLVEDNAINRMVAIKILEKLGAKVEIAKDGFEAVAQWQKGQYQLIFMDCQMPLMDGYEASRKIRALEKEKSSPHRIPIIALTAHAMEEDRERAISAGMDDYLTKPVKAEALHTALKTWINQNPMG